MNAHNGSRSVSMDALLSMFSYGGETGGQDTAGVALLRNAITQHVGQLQTLSDALRCPDRTSDDADLATCAWYLAEQLKHAAEIAWSLDYPPKDAESEAAQ